MSSTLLLILACVVLLFVLVRVASWLMRSVFTSVLSVAFLVVLVIPGIVFYAVMLLRLLVVTIRERRRAK